MFASPTRCSRLKPSYEFHFEKLPYFNSSVEGLVQNPRRQSENIEMKNTTHFKLVHELILYGTCFQYNVKN